MTLDASSDGGYTFDSGGDPVASDATIADGRGEVIFTNIAPGTTTVTLSSADNCTFESDRDSWPVEVKHITIINVVCAGS